jgi:hypothetical protein
MARLRKTEHAAAEIEIVCFQGSPGRMGHNDPRDSEVK